MNSGKGEGDLAIFKGGIHPDDAKNLTKDQPIRVLEPGKEMVFPLSQHIGAPATPLVKRGDEVKVGQLLGEANGLISANVVCSVSGKVKAVEPRLCIDGMTKNCVVVENDGLDTPHEEYGVPRDRESLDAESIQKAVRRAGLVGSGGAGFPTDVKLMPKDPDAIDTILINAAECEPYLTGDYRLMMERGEEILEGIRLLFLVFKNAKCIIGIEDNKKEAKAALDALIRPEDKIEVREFQTKYPQGGERFLIYAATGRQINSSLLPADAGCAVFNVDTVLSIYQAVLPGKMKISRIVTLTGDAVNEPGNYEVRLGMSVEDMIQAAGGYRVQPEKVVSGGPMMGTALFSTDVPVNKTCGGILCFEKDIVHTLRTTPCIRCGRCIDVCPGRVAPIKLMAATIGHRIEEFEKLYGMECCECGSCTYVCPAHRYLTQAFKQSKREVLEKRKG